MAAVPKKRPSKTRQRQRHSAWQNEFKLPDLVKCLHCGAKKFSHRVCKKCGYYKEMAIIEPKTTVKKVSART